jgi:hypothetical protein
MTIRNLANETVGPSTLGHNFYEYDWYSGSQISVMIGDVLVDSCVGIQFEVQQSRSPVYGYASQYYSFVAPGKVIVQGTLTVAFKEAGYLLWPMQRFINNLGPTKDTDFGSNDYSTSPRFTTDSDGLVIKGYEPKKYTFSEAANAAKRHEAMRASVEQMKEWESSGTFPRNNKGYNDFWKELGALPDDQWEDWAEVFEDSIWYGSDPSNPLMRDKLFSKNIPENQTSISEEEVYNHRRADQYSSIDIWIVYGDMSRHPANHTVRKLMDVSFIGQSQIIEISGQPTFEQYQFMARNLA